MIAMQPSFAIVAEPNRRAILSLLLTSERSVGELEKKLHLSQPSVSKHLKVLREAGFDAKFLKGGHSAWKALGVPMKPHVPA